MQRQAGTLLNAIVENETYSAIAVAGVAVPCSDPDMIKNTSKTNGTENKAQAAAKKSKKESDTTLKAGSELDRVFKGVKCHRSLQNQPAGVESKPATLR